jgi:pimeloyl-ACP methyl ester carboxylesterase
MEVVTTTVQVGAHWIEANVFGGGRPAVVIEPAYGGDAGSWQPIAEAIATETTVVTYNRAPYGASSAAVDGRKPREVARDLHGVLGRLALGGPFILIGHSLGGIYVRAYAAMYGEDVAGMVLVESSHEGQHKATRGHVPWQWRMHDVLAVPSILAESSTSRNGADRRSLIRELRTFKRMSEADRLLFPGDLGAKPLIVLTRGDDPATADSGFWPLWHGLHADLARLSSNSRHIVSDSPDHYLNTGDPDLIINSIRQAVRSVRTSAPLHERAASDAVGE